MQPQRDFNKELLEDLDELKDELFASLKNVLREGTEVFKARGRPKREFNKFLEQKRKFYTDQMNRLLTMQSILEGQMKVENYLLKQKREDHGLSQTELAEKLGVSRQWIGHLEGGEMQKYTGKISKRLKLRVCEILGVSFEEAFPIDHMIEMLIKKSEN